MDQKPSPHARALECKHKGERFEPTADEWLWILSTLGNLEFATRQRLNERDWFDEQNIRLRERVRVLEERLLSRE
jgi:hypothetical protein